MFIFSLQILKYLGQLNCTVNADIFAEPHWKLTISNQNYTVRRGNKKICVYLSEGIDVPNVRGK